MQLPNTPNCEEDEKCCGEEYVICPAETAVKLAAKDGATIEEKDAGAYFRNTGGNTQGWDANAIHASADEFYSTYRNLAAMEAKLKELVDNSGGIARMEELSPKTHEGRTIKAIRIRDKLWKSGRPRVVFTFQVHAREWVAGMTGVYVVEHLISALKTEPDFVEGMEVVLVPLSNPDGFAFSGASSRFWRKNRRDNPGQCEGVDLNRNWGPAWNGGQSTSTNPCDDIFVGSGARSEPETQALGKLVEEAPTLVHVDVHCFSELILGPWGYTKRDHPKKPQVDELGMAMQNAIKEVHGKTYKYGTGGANIYLASGCFSDWSTSKGAFGYTFELRPSGGGLRGFAPPPDQILPSAQEAAQGLYVAIDWAKDKGSPLPKPTTKPTTPPPAIRRRRGGNTRRRRRSSTRRRRRRRSSSSAPAGRRRSRR